MHLIIIALFIPLMIVGIGFFMFIGNAHMISGAIYHIKEMLTFYVLQNNGKFPESEDDLIDKYYLKKVKTTEGDIYFLPTDYNQDPDVHWRNFGEDIKNIKIAYGAKLQDIKMVDGKLYDKNTGELVFLIDGPYRGVLNYEEYSLRLYEEMLYYRNRKDNLVEISEPNIN